MGKLVKRGRRSSSSLSQESMNKYELKRQRMIAAQQKRNQTPKNPPIRSAAELQTRLDKIKKARQSGSGKGKCCGR